MRTALTTLALLFYIAPAQAQYPAGSGGQYPNQYPPGTIAGPMGIPISVPGIHLPAKKKKEDQKPAKVTVASLDGILRKLSEKELILQITSDPSSGKIARFRLIAKTEFVGKDNKPVRDSLLHPGDHLSIDANPDDPETALHVTLVKTGSDKDRETASNTVMESRIMAPVTEDFGKKRVVKDAEPAPGAASDSEPASDTAQPPAISSTNGRPSLHKGDDSDSAAAATPVTRSAAPSGPRMSDDSAESVLDDARSAAGSYSADLPNFLVQQVTTRFQGSRYGNSWKLMDTVTADVSSVNGKEEYKNIRVNGRPTDKPEDSGSWSTGEFQATLEDILSPRTDAKFTSRGEDRIAGRAAFVFDLQVEQVRSHWTIEDDRGHRIKPAYKGRIWIDKETRRVLRIEQTALNIPRDFSFDSEETALEYGFASIDGRSYLLPSTSVNVACGTGTSSCSKNRIDFRNYRKFSTDSNITFGN